MATASQDLQIVDLTGPKLLATIPTGGTRGEASACLLAISPDGQWAAVSYGAEVRIASAHAAPRLSSEVPSAALHPTLPRVCPRKSNARRDPPTILDFFLVWFQFCSVYSSLSLRETFYFFFRVCSGSYLSLCCVGDCTHPRCLVSFLFGFAL